MTKFLLKFQCTLICTNLFILFPWNGLTDLNGHKSLSWKCYCLSRRICVLWLIFFERFKEKMYSAWDIFWVSFILSNFLKWRLAYLSISLPSFFHWKFIHWYFHDHLRFHDGAHKFLRTWQELCIAECNSLAFRYYNYDSEKSLLFVVRIIICEFMLHFLLLTPSTVLAELHWKVCHQKIFFNWPCWMN